MEGAYYSEFWGCMMNTEVRKVKEADLRTREEIERDRKIFDLECKKEQLDEQIDELEDGPARSALELKWEECDGDIFELRYPEDKEVG